jgi:hypothetical protein
MLQELSRSKNKDSFEGTVTGLVSQNTKFLVVNVITKPEPLVAKLLKARYFPNIEWL